MMGPVRVGEAAGKTFVGCHHMRGSFDSKLFPSAEMRNSYLLKKKQKQQTPQVSIQNRGTFNGVISVSFSVLLFLVDLHNCKLNNIAKETQLPSNEEVHNIMLILSERMFLSVFFLYLLIFSCKFPLRLPY